MTKTGMLVLLALVVTGGGARLAAAADGAALYAPCSACHGADGSGNNALDAPALAGQDPAYLRRQIANFRNGVRGTDERDTTGRQMQAMAMTLADPADLDAVLAHIGTFRVPANAAAVEHNKRNGEVQYNAACGACHGPAAQGNPALNAPNLAILDETYLRRQFRYFAEGVRGSHPDDKYGRQMQMMSGMLSTEEDLDDVIGFILSR